MHALTAHQLLHAVSYERKIQWLCRFPNVGWPVMVHGQEGHSAWAWDEQRASTSNYCHLSQSWSAMLDPVHAPASPLPSPLRCADRVGTLRALQQLHASTSARAADMGQRNSMLAMAVQHARAGMGAKQREEAQEMIPRLTRALVSPCWGRRRGHVYLPAGLRAGHAACKYVSKQLLGRGMLPAHRFRGALLWPWPVRLSLRLSSLPLHWPGLLPGAG